MYQALVQFLIDFLTMRMAPEYDERDVTEVVLPQNDGFQAIYDIVRRYGETTWWRYLHFLYAQQLRAPPEENTFRIAVNAANLAGALTADFGTTAVRVADSSPFVSHGAADPFLFRGSKMFDERSYKLHPYIPDYSLVPHYETRLTHVTRDLAELARLIELIYQGTLNQTQGFVQEFLKKFLNTEGNVYARTLTPQSRHPSTLTARAIVTLMRQSYANIDNFYRIAARIRKYFCTPEMQAFWIPTFSTILPYTATAEDPGELAQIRTRDVVRLCLERARTISRSAIHLRNRDGLEYLDAQSPDAQLESLESLSQKRFGLCESCGIFPFRLITLPSTTASFDRQWGRWAQDQNPKSWEQLAGDPDLLRTMRNSSCIIQAVRDAYDPDRLLDLATFNGANRVDALRLQIVVLRDVLTLTYGPDVAAMIIETTLLRDPVMAQLARLSKQDIPFVDGKTLVVSARGGGLPPDDTELGDTGLTVRSYVELGATRVSLYQGQRELQPEEAASAVLGAIRTDIGANLAAVLGPRDDPRSRAVRRRMCERYLMLNGHAAASRRIFTDVPRDDQHRWDISKAFNCPELHVMWLMANGASGLVGNADLAYVYCPSLEMYTKERDSPKLRDIFARAHLFEQSFGPHYKAPAGGAHVRTWDPSPSAHGPEWGRIVDEFMDWAAERISTGSGAQVPSNLFAMITSADAPVYGRGDEQDRAVADPSFGATTTTTDTKVNEVLTFQQVDSLNQGGQQAILPERTAPGTLPTISYAQTFNNDNLGPTECPMHWFTVGSRAAIPTRVATEWAKCTYNSTPRRPQLFAALDACALLLRRRAFHNSAETRLEDKGGAGTREPSEGGVESMHYWAAYWARVWLVARQAHDTKFKDDPEEIYEYNVKTRPDLHFTTDLIGKMTDDEFLREFPLIPLQSSFRRKVERMRGMHMYWGTLNNYSPQGYYRNNVAQTTVQSWMPLPHSHAYQMLRAANLFDTTYQVPINPFLHIDPDQPWSFAGFRHSYHSILNVGDLEPQQYEDWCESHCRHQVANEDGERAFVPFSRYGGTPVTADFVPHPVTRPADGYEDQHRALCYARYGQLGPLKLGELVYEDRGYLQDMFNYGYRKSVALSPEQMDHLRLHTTNVVGVSNFMAYARVHAIIALASRAGQGATRGDDLGEGDDRAIVRNMFRLYSDAYRYVNADRDEVPSLVGYAPMPMMQKSNPDRDRPVIIYAAPLSHLRALLEQYKSMEWPTIDRKLMKDVARGVFEVTTLISRVVESERFSESIEASFKRARAANPSITKEQYMHDMMVNLWKQRNYHVSGWLGSVLAKSGESSSADTEALLAVQHLIRPLDPDMSYNEPHTELNEYVAPQLSGLGERLGDDSRRLTPKAMAQVALASNSQRILESLYVQRPETVDVRRVQQQLLEHQAANKQEARTKELQQIVAGLASGRYEMASGGGASDMESVDFLTNNAGRQAVNPTFDPNVKVVDSYAASTPAQFAGSGDRSGGTQVSSVIGLDDRGVAALANDVREKVEQAFQAAGKFRSSDPSRSRREILDAMTVPDFIKRTLYEEPLFRTEYDY